MRSRIVLLAVACLALATTAPRAFTLWEMSGTPAAATGAAAAAAAPAAPPPAADLRLPLEPHSVRFAVIGDSGTGEAAQYQVAQEMEKRRQSVGFDFVIMLGDNIYGGKDPSSFASKFDRPYKPLLDAGVKFYASLGNHDDPGVERLYAPFNMGGSRYYTFRRSNVAFFVLDSNYMDSVQLDWLERQLQSSGTEWKICYFHHPLYSYARAHGSDLDLRAKLAPLFAKYGVNVVLSGHDHVYERVQPQAGIYYFVLGNSGQLRYHDLKTSPDLVTGFDTDQDFMLVEISGNKLYFQTISRAGQTVDSGVLQEQPKPAALPQAGAVQ